MTTAAENITPESYLIADCGSTYTSVQLFDVIDGTYRLVGQARAATTITAPWSDLMYGLLNAIQDLAQMLGRTLLENERLIIPEKPGHVGVDHFMLVVSAAPPLRTILVGLSEEISLTSARQVLHTVYAQEVDTFSLTDGRPEDQQVATIIKEEPDLIFLTGGTDGGADQRLITSARTVSLAVSMLSGTKNVSVLFAGNKDQREQIRYIMGEASFYVAGNVRPTLDTQNLDDASQVIGKLYAQLRIRELPGLHRMNKWLRQPPLPTARAFATITQYLAALQKGRVLGVELGTESVTLVQANPDKVDLTIRSDLGMGRILTNLLRYVTPEQIANWLPEEISHDDIRDYIYNKSLNPHTMPMTEADLHLDQALARATLRCVVNDTAVSPTDHTLPPFRLLLARGLTFSHAPRAGQIIAALLDSLQPVGLFAVAFDRYNILPTLGALALHQPLAAVQTLESNVLQNLGWVVVPVGKGEAGENVLHVSIESQQHTQYEGDVQFGTLETFFLEPGSSQVTLTPAKGFDIGLGAGKGKTFTLSGGAVGLVVDARGRPLKLPEDDVARRSQIQQWLYDMGG